MVMIEAGFSGITGFVVCDVCGEEIEYCGITGGEELDAHMKEEHGR